MWGLRSSTFRLNVTLYSHGGQGGSLVPPHTHESVSFSFWGSHSSTVRLNVTLISRDTPGDVTLSVTKAAQVGECTSLFSGPTIPDVDDMLKERPQCAYGGGGASPIAKCILPTPS